MINHRTQKLHAQQVLEHLAQGLAQPIALPRETIEEALRAAIMNGGLEPGERLTQQAIAQYRNQAQAAARDFGYAGYALREVSIGSLQGASPAPRPMFRAMAAVPLGEQAIPIEAGVRALGVTVSGSVQLQR